MAGGHEKVEQRKRAAMAKREANRQKRAAGRKVTSGGAVVIDDRRVGMMVFEIIPGISKAEAYRRLWLAETLNVYWKRFRHHDARQSAASAGRVELRIEGGIPWAVARVVERELSAAWQKGKVC